MGITGDVMTPTVLYNGMIAPLLPYAIRGVIWYQGEANVRREQQYRSLFPATIADWRRAWGTDLPFLFVQIAPFREMTPELREAQLLAWQHTPKTAMVVTTDCGDANDIHPPHKQPVGARLALAARAMAYGERVEYSGPRLRGDQGQARQGHADLHARGRRSRRQGRSAQGLHAGWRRRQRSIRRAPRFAARRWSSPAKPSPQPVAVRYGWANVPDGNLFNKAGLPASPFRTDAN